MKDKEFLDSIRTQILYYLCKRESISEARVEKFENTFNEMRMNYPALVGEMDAGAHEKAPHNKQYLIASRVVKWLEDQMKLDDEKTD